ncbi:RecQ family ATP-dependent DNA helicase [Brevibacillus laterosporus]|uniref:RecQ family ATP-dependent DNA helicase n=1 Tax=Brevibacillus laterosporus TaxID=1465 RepID=UPI001EF33085|nr:ATP-dependent DNA helicase RecQ [Brevibacillus laterosporus]MCG7316804.1 RecQ family ATP-dependent DNA helicase [Brevibacillus laterosporus]
METNMKKIRLILQQYFGHATFRTGQEEIISRILQGKNVLGIMSTGGGKSLTYQVPAYLLPGITLVVSPLISLMVDQVQQLLKNGHRLATYINSSLDRDEIRLIVDELEAGKYKLVYISPEKLQQPSIIRLLQKRGVSLVAIDEAHCISQWGHDFRTDYLKLPSLVKSLGQPPVLAVTATATHSVAQEIAHLFDIDLDNQIRHSVNRSNIAYDLYQASDEADKKTRLLAQLRECQKPGIVYCSTRQAVDQLVLLCQREGIQRVSGFHGGMNPMERILIQEQFIANQLDVIIATNAFGMGIDKSDIRFVIHYHLPASIEAYTQEVGRIGRDQHPGYACLYVQEEDVHIHHRLFQNEYPTDEELVAFLELLRNSVHASDSVVLAREGYEQKLTHEELFAAIGIGENVTRFLFYYAQEAGAVRSVQLGKSGYTYWFQPHDPQVVFATMKQRIQLVKRSKYAKLGNMQEWIQSSGCYRESLLAYFGERLINNPESCCRACGINRTLYLESTKPERVAQESAWNLQEALERLLPHRPSNEGGAASL